MTVEGFTKCRSEFLQRRTESGKLVCYWKFLLTWVGSFSGMMGKKCQTARRDGDKVGTVNVDSPFKKSGCEER